MKKLGFYKNYRESFSTKVFYAFSVFIVIVSSVFTFFFIHHQTKNIKEDLKKRGTMLSGLLAYDSRTGIFAENKDLIENAVQGIMNQEGVLSVSIFTPDKKAFFIKQKNPSQKRHPGIDDETRRRTMSNLTGSPSLEVIEGEETIEFLRPVTLGVSSHPEEALYFYDKDLKKTEEVIGYVDVMLDKTILNRAIRYTLINSILIAAAFLFSGIIVVYITSQRVLRPLTVLTEAVKMFGAGKSAEKVPIKTNDEIGKLAEAFNVMSENLTKREEEKRLLEEKLAHAHKMEAIGQFAGGIAHDFNNRLAAIMNYGHVLKMKMTMDDPLRVYVEQMLASSERAADLTQSLLAFGRKQIITTRPEDLNNVIRTVEKLLQRIIGEDIEIKSYLVDKVLTVMADRGQIEQVFMNLIKNARDAMPEGGFLTISTEPVEFDDEYIRTHGFGRPGMYALVSVTDTGAGIDEKIRQRIFEPFFTTKGVGKGTGLGLSIVYGIIEQHNGYISCYSESGKGTTFKIYLPLTETSVEEMKPTAPISLMRGTETVLLAEDNLDVREITKEVLEDAGYKVIAAVDGEDAIVKFMDNKDKIELLLLDAVMPKKRGKEVYEEIKKIRPDIKALFSSGFAPDIVNKNGLLEEGLNFISKPASPIELLKKVREVLDKPN